MRDYPCPHTHPEHGPCITPLGAHAFPEVHTSRQGSFLVSWNQNNPELRRKVSEDAEESYEIQTGACRDGCIQAAYALAYANDLARSDWRDKLRDARWALDAVLENLRFAEELADKYALGVVRGDVR